jgi:hypothetical protein
MIKNAAWLLSAFALSSSLMLACDDAEAKKSGKSSRIQVRQAHHSVVVKTPAKPKWSWEEARLQAIFIKDENGNYRIEELPNGKNETTRLPIASVAKMVAAAVVFDAIDKGEISFDDMVPVLPETWTMKDSDFATKGLSRSLKEIPLRDALAHTVKLSSNPMIYNIAVFVAGSSQNFVERMNAKAREWGMNDTNFVTESGLPVGDRKQEYSTAKDLLVLALRIWQNFSKFKEFTHNRLNYWNPPKPKPREIVTEEAKERLRKLGAVFKTGTVDGCDLMVAVAPIPDWENAAAASVQACALKYTRFGRAESSLKKMFAYVANVFHTGSKPIENLQKIELEAPEVKLLELQPLELKRLEFTPPEFLPLAPPSGP